MAGELNYFNIPIADAERAKAFYGTVLGWEFQPRADGEGYQVTNANPPGGIVSGREGSTAHVYFRVDDIQVAAASVRELGGTAEEPVEFTEGASSECRDDQGIGFGLFQPVDGV